MICKNNKCKAELPDDAIFCFKCGAKQDIAVNTEAIGSKDDIAESSSEKTVEQKTKKVAFIIVGILSVIALLYLIYVISNNDNLFRNKDTLSTSTIATEAEEELVFSLSKCPVKVNEVYTSAPNSVGGIDLIFYWENTANNDIKYIYVYVTPYNRVGDVESSDIGNKTTVKCRLVGPYQTGDGGRAEFETVWYNSMISYAEVDMIEIEYIGGWTETFVN